MVDTLKVLGQSIPLTGVLTNLYTVPNGAQTSISSLVVCNQSNVGSSFNITVAIGGAADTAAQYLYFEQPIGIGDTFVATIGISLAAGDIIRCLSSTGSVSFNLFGVELS